MKFYFDKFKELRKNDEVTGKRICKKLNINKMTLWRWETGRVTPGEENIRKLAEAINVPVSVISDLAEKQKPTSHLSIVYPSKENKYKKIIDELIDIQKNADRRNALLKAVLASGKIILYVKNINQKYLAVNDAFLDHLGLEPDTNCEGKTDFSFFCMEEAKKNTKEDCEILATGKPLENMRRILPGSKKKKTCLCSKYPVMDDTGKVSGLASTFTDISDIAESEILIALLRKVLDNIPFPVLFLKNVDSSPEVIYANNAYSEPRKYNEKMSFSQLVENSKEIALPEYKQLINDISSAMSFPESGTITGYMINGSKKYYKEHSFSKENYRIIFFEEIKK